MLPDLLRPCSDSVPVLNTQFPVPDYVPRNSDWIVTVGFHSVYVTTHHVYICCNVAVVPLDVTIRDYVVVAVYVTFQTLITLL